MKKLMLLVIAITPLFSFAQNFENKLNIYISSFSKDADYLPETCRKKCGGNYIRLHNACSISITDDEVIENFRNLFFEPNTQTGSNAKIKGSLAASYKEKKNFMPDIVIDFTFGIGLFVEIDRWGYMVINFLDFYEPSKEVMDYLEKHLPSSFVTFIR